MKDYILKMAGYIKKERKKENLLTNILKTLSLKNKANLKQLCNIKLRKRC